MAFAIRMKSLLSLVGVFSVLSTVAADTKITYPDSDSMTFYAGDVVTVKYITDYAGPKLNVFCYKDTGDGIVNRLVETITAGTGSKTVTLDLGTGVNGCWFNIQNNNDIWGVNSPVWNYKQSRPSQQTSTVASPSPVEVPETPSTPAPTTGSGSGSNGGSNGGNTAVPSMTSPNTENIPSSAALTVEAAGGSAGSTPTGGSGSNGSGGTAASPQPTTASSSGGSSSSGTSNGSGGNGSSNSVNASLVASANPFVMTIDGSTTTISPTATATLSTGGSTGNGNSNNVDGSGSAGSSGTSGGNADNSGLSTGAKAGIGAAVAICALLAIASLVFFILARRKQKRGGSQMSELPVEETYGVIGKNGSRGLSSGGRTTPPTQYYNGGAGPYEMDNGQRMPELHTLERPQEVASPVGEYPRDDRRW